TALGIGILLGAKWAYEEVGWGGYYGWDPVENAALMPWLASTAFLHSVMVQEKKNMLRVWNAILVSLAFCLSLFGTFLTRSGVLITVGPPYFNFFLRVFGLPLLLLMGIGPLVAWRRSSLRALGLSLLWPTAVAVVAGGVLIGLGAGSNIGGLVAYTFSVFVLAAIVLEFTRGTRARKALGERTWPGAFSSLVGRNRRRYGGYVVHAAIVLLAVGIAGGAYGATRVQHLKSGEAMTIRGYRLEYLGAVVRQGPNALEARARLAVSRDGQSVGTLMPG